MRSQRCQIPIFLMCFHLYWFHWHPIIIWITLRPNSGRLSQKSYLVTTRIYQQADYVIFQSCQTTNFAMFFFIFISFIDIQSSFGGLWDQIRVGWVKNQIFWQLGYINRHNMWDPKDVKFKILQCVFIFIGFIDIKSTFGVLCIRVGKVKNEIFWQLSYINRWTMWDTKDDKFLILQCVFIFFGFH